MMNRISIRGLALRLFWALLLASILLSGSAMGQTEFARAQAPGGPEVIRAWARASASRCGPSPGCRLPQAPQGMEINPVRPLPSSASQALTPEGPTDSAIVQSAPVGPLVPAAGANFDGIGSTGYRPPDTEGDIGYDPASGKKYYMQFVNVSYQIWDVTNPASPVSVAGPSAGHNLVERTCSPASSAAPPTAGIRLCSSIILPTAGSPASWPYSASQQFPSVHSGFADCRSDGQLVRLRFPVEQHRHQ